MLYICIQCIQVYNQLENPSKKRENLFSIIYVIVIIRKQLDYTRAGQLCAPWRNIEYVDNILLMSFCYIYKMMIMFKWEIIKK